MFWWWCIIITLSILNVKDSASESVTDFVKHINIVAEELHFSSAILVTDEQFKRNEMKAAKIPIRVTFSSIGILAANQSSYKCGVFLKLENKSIIEDVFNDLEEKKFKDGHTIYWFIYTEREMST